MAVPRMTAAEFEALGLYDPSAPHASQRLELLEYLMTLGATADDLVAYRAELPGLASVVAIRGGPALTLAEAVERSTLAEAKVLELTRAAGFPEPGPDDRVFTQRFVELAAGMAAAEAIFGEEAVLQLVRVIGSAMARVADAIVSAFLVNVEPGARSEDPVGLAVARANAEAAALLPVVNPAFDVLLRQHLIGARRTILGDAGDAGYETQRLFVGFVDLVGSTTLAQRLSTRELGAVLTEFENVASDAVTAAGGRVVKLIGDEILYTTTDELSACTVALDLATSFADHPDVPMVRAAVAGGDVLLRDGDVFGPVVNLAARAVKVAGPGEVVAPPSVATAAGLEAEPLGQQAMKGFDDAVELCRHLRRRQPALYSPSASDRTWPSRLQSIGPRPGRRGVSSLHAPRRRMADRSVGWIHLRTPRGQRTCPRPDGPGVDPLRLRPVPVRLGSVGRPRPTLSERPVALSAATT
jgi:class 3 adenylate cyclase